MPKKIFFTPGPSALYFTVESHIKQALKEQVGEINHRAAQAQGYFKEATENLKALMNIPEDYHIFFLSSANEIWERLIQNCIIKQSTHLTYGAFSDRFYSFAKKWGIDATQIAGEYGSIPKIDFGKIPAETELIGLTLNETSTGVTFPADQIYELRKQFPNALIAIDGVSAFPAIDVDFSQIDSAYFSVQKCFGLPAGLGVWIVNDRCVNKAELKLAAGHSIGAYHALPNLLENSKKHQPSYTANVLNIYLLAKVSADMLEKGIEVIRRETNYKGALLQHLVTEHPDLSHFVEDPKLRSKTVVVANTEKNSEVLINALLDKGFVIGSGYGPYKNRQIRIASFPTHSKEQIELLVDVINGLNL